MAIALFDLDNTLIAGDSDHLWGEFLCHVGAVDVAEYRAKNDAFFQDYQAGTLDIIAYNEFCLTPLREHSLETMQQWRADFMTDIITPIILPAGQSQIKAHQDNGDTIVIITATNEFITAPIAAGFGIEQLIATTPEIVDAQYTGKLYGTPCFQDGKVERLNAWLGDEGSLQGSYFYSDSINDLPLLSRVDHPVAVDPDEKLRAHAHNSSWPIISFRDAMV